MDERSNDANARGARGEPPAPLAPPTTPGPRANPSFHRTLGVPSMALGLLGVLYGSWDVAAWLGAATPIDIPQVFIGPAGEVVLDTLVSVAWLGLALWLLVAGVQAMRGSDRAIGFLHAWAWAKIIVALLRAAAPWLVDAIYPTAQSRDALAWVPLIILTQLAWFLGWTWWAWCILLFSWLPRRRQGAQRRISGARQ